MATYTLVWDRVKSAKADATIDNPVYTELVARCGNFSILELPLTSGAAVQTDHLIVYSILVENISGGADPSGTFGMSYSTSSLSGRNPVLSASAGSSAGGVGNNGQVYDPGTPLRFFRVATRVTITATVDGIDAGAVVVEGTPIGTVLPAGAFQALFQYRRTIPIPAGPGDGPEPPPPAPAEQSPFIAFPKPLPGPLLPGYSDSREDVSHHTEPDFGVSRVRPVYKNSARKVTAAWEFSHAQFLIFDNWFIDTTKSGTKKFYIHIADNDQGLAWWVATMSEGWTAELIVPGDRWLVSADMRVFGDPLTDRPFFGDLDGYTELVLFSSAELTVTKNLYGLVEMTLDATGVLKDPVHQALYGISPIALDSTAPFFVPLMGLYGLATLDVTGSGRLRRDLALQGLATLTVVSTGELTAPVGGTPIDLYGDSTLELDASGDLTGGTPVAGGSSGLRDDGGYELRDDGGKELRSE